MKQRNKETNVTTTEFKPAALDEGGALADVMAENLMGEGLGPNDLTVVRFPREAPVWTVGDETVKVLRGVIIRQQVTRTFYIGEYEGGNAPPDCSSADGTTGRPQVVDGDLTYDDGSIERPQFEGGLLRFGGNCMKCPLNQWESDLKGGRGKACREYRNLVMVTEDDPLPIIVRIPPTQLRTWRDFMVALTKRRVVASQALVSLGLKKGQGSTGAPELEPVFEGVISAEMRDALVPLGGSLLAQPERPGLLVEPPHIDDDLIASEEPF